MLKQWLLKQVRQVKTTFTSFTNTAKRSLFFYSLYALISLLVLFSLAFFSQCLSSDFVNYFKLENSLWFILVEFLLFNYRIYRIRIFK